MPVFARRQPFMAGATRQLPPLQRLRPTSRTVAQAREAAGGLQFRPLPHHRNGRSALDWLQGLHRRILAAEDLDAVRAELWSFPAHLIDVH